MGPYFPGPNFGITAVLPATQEGWTRAFYTDTTKKGAMPIPEKKTANFIRLL